MEYATGPPGHAVVDSNLNGVPRDPIRSCSSGPPVVRFRTFPAASVDYFSVARTGIVFAVTALASGSGTVTLRIPAV